MKIDKFNVGTSQSENKSENPNNWLFRTTLAAQKVKSSIRKFFTFTEEVLNGKLHFLCSEFNLSSKSKLVKLI